MSADKVRIGARLRAERKERGWDKPEMIARLRAAAGERRDSLPSHDSLYTYLKRWERGIVAVSERYRMLYARAFGVDEAELFSEHHVASVPFIETEIQPPARVDAEDVVVIRSMLTALTASDRQFGGGHARDYAATFLTTVIEPRLRANGKPSVLNELFTVAIEFNLRTASMHLDGGHPRASRDLLGASFILAQHTRTPALAAWVLARCAEQDLHEEHIDVALTYTQGAAAMARSASPGARAFIFTKHALALSRTGDRAGTMAVLRDVWDAHDATGNVPEPEWMQVYGWQHLRHEEARCLLNLGMGDLAVRAAEESMRERPSGRPRAFSLAVQALGHAQKGDLDHACAVARQLVALAEQLQSDRVMLRIGDVVTALQPHHGVTAVDDLLDAARPLLQVRAAARRAGNDGG